MSQTKSFAALLLIILVIGGWQTAVPVSAQTLEDTPIPNGASEFRFVTTSKSTTMEKELNELAAQGFRVERVSKSSYGDDIAALLVRNQAQSTDARPTDDKSTAAARYEYKLLATRKASTLEKEIQEAAADGFEFRGLTSVIRLIPYSLGNETIAVMERQVGATARRYDYKMLSTKREATTQKELNEAVTAGYIPVSVLRGQDNGAASLLFGPNFVITIILAREVDNPTETSSSREYKFLTTSKVSTMEKEMNQAVKEGYRFYLASSDLLMLMSREQGVKTPAPYTYKLLATRKTATMQKELLEQGAKGFRYRATTGGLGGLTTVLEREQNAELASSHTYKLLAALRETTTQKEIGEAVTAGYRILDLTTIGEFILILDQPTDSAPAKASVN